MSHYTILWAVIAYVENRLRTGVDCQELAAETGFSLPYLRELFSKRMGQSLARYILHRRISSAAFDLIHTNQSILQIQENYGFSNPDTFTRAFRRFMGTTPRMYRKQRPVIGNVKLYTGIYGVSERLENRMKGKQISKNSTILYGVPKVGYGIGGFTPYPMCLKAVANYIGEDMDYDYAMVSCGAAFRLAWNETCWDGGNVDIMLTYEDAIQSYRMGAQALGYGFRLLGRANNRTILDNPTKYATLNGNGTKEDFIAFIRQEIDKGRPCIGLGIIGPPEACVITGYQDNGATLLGWNFFQEDPSLTSEIGHDKSGYFVTNQWWENEETVAVMALGEKESPPYTVTQIAEQAVAALSPRRYGGYARGIAAYDAWKRAIMDDSQFPKEQILSLLVERMMCQGDAMGCLADGRNNAASYFQKLAESNPKQPLYQKIADRFGDVLHTVDQMAEVLGGFERGEENMRLFANPETRRKLAKQIDCCKAADEEALLLLTKLCMEV